MARPKKVVTLKEETPKEETPEEETPVEETPVEETPVEETPVEETPVEETPVEETPKKALKVLAEKCNLTNPYTGDVYRKGILRETPKTKDSWYESQIEGKYLKEVEV